MKKHLNDQFHWVSHVSTAADKHREMISNSPLCPFFIKENLTNVISIFIQYIKTYIMNIFCIVRMTSLIFNFCL